MMIRYTIAVAAAALALVTLVPAARAQGISSPYRFVDENQSLEGFVGHVWSDPGTVGLGPRDGAIFGARYTLRATGPMNIGGELGYLRSDRAVIDEAGEAVGEADIDLLLFIAALRFDLTGPRTYHRMMPYLELTGGGATNLSGSDPDPQPVPIESRYDFGTSFAAGLGGGVDLFVAPRAVLRASARALLWKVVTPENLRGRDFEAPREEWVRNTSLTVGASYRF